MYNYWQTEKVFLDGDHFFDELIHDIDLAKEYITVEIYIFNDDSLGNKIAAHLISARQRGVKVQIIVDGIGSYGFFDKLHGVFTKWGVQVKMYHPLPFYHPYYGNLSLRKKVQALFVRLWSLNRRNHRKIVTIDSDKMYLGSFNFTAEHTRFHNDKKWKDMGVKVTGENVKLAILQFKRIWKIRDFFRYRKQVKHLINKRRKSSPLRLNHSVFMKRFYYKDILKRIQRAEKRIWLMTPYFIPKGRLIKELGKAAERGIDVKVLISSKTDVKIFQALQFFYYPFLLKKGVNVFHYVDTVLHAKNVIIDDWMTVGTSNLNHRSLLHDLEVDLVIQEQKNREIIEDNFTSSVTQQQITMEYLKQRSLFDRFLSRLFFLFKYWF